MAPHRALLSIPGTEHNWSATGRAYPICPAATAVNTSGRRIEETMHDGGNAIGSSAELTFQCSTLLPQSTGQSCFGSRMTGMRKLGLGATAAARISPL